MTSRTVASTPVAEAQRALLRELPDPELDELRDCYRELLHDCDAEILRRIAAKPCPHCGEARHPGVRCV